ncbi:MAG TPA: Hpt domain-containing protein [Thermodesulfobacteriota bacterium]|nr:Hpt domain-containing protein [Thermodesulfobacteriota bacterium]
MDLKQLAARLELEEDEFLEMMNLFVEVTESDLRKLQSAMEREELQEAVFAAHSIKGAAANLGLTGISEKAKRAEAALRGRQLDEAREAVRGIQEKLFEVTRDLSQGER